MVHGLTAGETYIFRVQAVNAYGLSEESQESAPLFVDAALSKHTARFVWVSSAQNIIDNYLLS